MNLGRSEREEVVVVETVAGPAVLVCGRNDQSCVCNAILALDDQRAQRALRALRLYHNLPGRTVRLAASKMSFLLGPVSGALVAGGVRAANSCPSRQLTFYHAGVLWIHSNDSNKVGFVISVLLTQS